MKRVFVLVVLVTMLLAACRGGDAATTSTPTATSPQSTVTTPTTSLVQTVSTTSDSPPSPSYPIGLEGEIANIPGALASQYDWSKYGQYAADFIDMYAAVGGRISRINVAQTRGPGMPDIEQYGYDTVDALVAAYQSHGVEVAMTLAYQRVLNGGKGADVTQPWLWTTTAERDRYESYVRAMLERYDGDGIDDAPGLRYPIRVWQIHNELEAQWASAREQGVTTWATPDDYATLLQFTAQIIREEIPDAVIVASQYPWPGHDAADFDGDGQQERYIERVAALGGYEGIDVVEIHDFGGDLKRLVGGLTYAHEASGLPVWAGQVLATNAPVGGQPDASPATQAEKVVKLLVGSLAVGAEQAHWWGVQNAPENVEWRGGLLFARSGLYQPCPADGMQIGQVCSDPPLFPAGVNFRLLADAFIGYEGIDPIEPLSLGVVPGRADSSRLVVRVDRQGDAPFVIAWDDAGGSLQVDDLFGGPVTVTHFVTEEGAEPVTEEGVIGEVPLTSTPVMIVPTAGTAATPPAVTTTSIGPSTTVSDDTSAGPAGAFIAFHLEVSKRNRVATLWPRLVEFMDLADRYGVKVTLQFSAPWASYVESQGLLDTVHAWEAEGHEIALHHHGPAHKFFDGYTNAPEAVRTDGWYATPGDYVGDMSALMELLAPLTERGITSAGMSDADTDWPEGVLYYATDSGETPSKDDLLSQPVETVHNGYPVVEIYNAGYEIAHLGPAAVTLDDVEEAIRTATAADYLGLVFNDETIEEDFALIEPLFELLKREGVAVETVSELLAARD